MPTLSKKQIGLLVFLDIAVLSVQLPAIQRPFTGDYASYQGTVMAAIARNMVRENFSELLLPKNIRKMLFISVSPYTIRHSPSVPSE